MKFELFIAIISGIGGMIGWGLSDFFSAKAMKKERISEDESIFSVYFITSIILFLIVILTKQPIYTLTASTIFQMLVFTGMNVAAYLLFYKALKIGTFSIISTLFSTYAVGSTLISILFFKEATNFSRIIYLLLIFLGISTVSIKTFKKIKLIKGFFFVIGAALILSIFFPLWDAFLKNNGESFFWITLGNSLTSIFFLVYAKFIKKSNFKNLLKNPKTISLAAISNAIAVISINWGLANTSLTSVIIVISSAVPLISAILGYKFFHEKLTKIQYIGIIIIVSGMALLFSS